MTQLQLELQIEAYSGILRKRTAGPHPNDLPNLSHNERLTRIQRLAHDSHVLGALTSLASQIHSQNGKIRELRARRATYEKVEAQLLGQLEALAPRLASHDVLVRRTAVDEERFLTWGLGIVRGSIADRVTIPTLLQNILGALGNVLGCRNMLHACFLGTGQGIFTGDCSQAFACGHPPPPI